LSLEVAELVEAGVEDDSLAGLLESDDAVEDDAPLLGLDASVMPFFA
jgi:hypothetical protein